MNLFKKKQLRCNTCGKIIDKKIGVHEMCDCCFQKGANLIMNTDGVEWKV